MLLARVARYGTAGERQIPRLRRMIPRSAASRRLALGVALPTAALVLWDASQGPVLEKDLPRHYDEACFGAIWTQRPARAVYRACSVLCEAVPLATSLALAAGLGELGSEEVQRQQACALREALVRLGPALIKLGQAMSIRPDILPAPVLVELQRLVDACPCFADEKAHAIVLAELGKNFGDLFDAAEFGIKPVAAASLGQVYRVRVRGTGEVVAVKVQRPDMMASISLDLQILAVLASTLDLLTATFTRQQPYHCDLLRAFASAAWAELDYENEASNQERFRRNFGCENSPRDDSQRTAALSRRSSSWLPLRRGTADNSSEVYIPRVYHEFTSRRVLTTEWIEGEYLARSPPAVIRRLVPIGVNCFLKQLCTDGFFHCDPHPGNLLVTPGGRLALIDFGLCAEVPLPHISRISAAIVHTMSADTVQLVEDGIALGFLPVDVDRTELVPLIQNVLSTSTKAVLEQGAEAASLGVSSSYGAVQRRKRHFSNITDDLNGIFFRFPFRVPDYFAVSKRKGTAIVVALPCHTIAIDAFSFAQVLSSLSVHNDVTPRSEPAVPVDTYSAPVCSLDYFCVCTCVCWYVS
mmetsp:Transcript_24746/g.61431  ORF Transcript_24746/g.61431 Transcript_24746/m.61431 type:complete len:583 (+) Transcript_24746:67-1815(+)